MRYWVVWQDDRVRHVLPAHNREQAEELREALLHDFYIFAEIREMSDVSHRVG